MTTTPPHDTMQEIIASFQTRAPQVRLLGIFPMGEATAVAFEGPTSKRSVFCLRAPDGAWAAICEEERYQLGRVQRQSAYEGLARWLDDDTNALPSPVLIDWASRPLDSAVLEALDACIYAARLTPGERQAIAEQAPPEEQARLTALGLPA